MSQAFTKLFSSITESTVWGEPYPTRILWIAMLAMADRDGRVNASVPGLARRAGITLEECETALATFLKPDRYSRTPDHEGRRIKTADGGWSLLNYAKYRNQRDEETKRAADAERQRLHRDVKRSAKAAASASPADCHDESVTGRDSHAMSQEVAQAEAEAEAEADKNNTERVRARPTSISIADLVAEGVSESAAADWLALRKHKRAPLTPRAWEALKREAGKAGWTLDAAVSKAAERGWQNFEAEWVQNSGAKTKRTSRLDVPPVGTNYGSI
ncbi:hypothetical protein [Panacagrimonas sp.]|uniref:hypothetical protein n=1 Tax=Panacagrimonas sp. TaxID=2480088 RepID=UPI003B529D4A